MAIEQELELLRTKNSQLETEILKSVDENTSLSTTLLGKIELTVDDKIAKKVEEQLESISKTFEEQLKQTTEIRTTPKTKKNYEVIFCMDSNSKFIRFKKFWTLNKSLRRRIYTQPQLKTFIQNLEADSISTILIQVGVNDIDTKTGEEVFREVQENVHLLKTKFPGIKIVLAELTPRKDEKDTEVNNCNNLINSWAPGEGIFVASHANLREDKNTFLHDNKHITKRCIGVFVVNLKKALCQAAGVEYIGRADYNREREVPSG